MSTHWHIYYVNFIGRAKEIEKLFHFISYLDAREFVHENDGFGETWLGKYLRKAGITDFNKDTCKGYVQSVHIMNANWFEICVMGRTFIGNTIWEEVVNALGLKSIKVYCGLPQKDKKAEWSNSNMAEEQMILVENIEWDLDGQNPYECCVPTNIILPTKAIFTEEVPEVEYKLAYDEIIDYLTDMYEYCINSCWITFVKS